MIKEIIKVRLTINKIRTSVQIWHRKEWEGMPTLFQNVSLTHTTNLNRVSPVTWLLRLLYLPAFLSSSLVVPLSPGNSEIYMVPVVISDILLLSQWRSSPIKKSCADVVKHLGVLWLLWLIKYLMNQISFLILNKITFNFHTQASQLVISLSYFQELFQWQPV